MKAAIRPTGSCGQGLSQFLWHEAIRDQDTVFFSDKCPGAYLAFWLKKGEGGHLLEEGHLIGGGAYFSKSTKVKRTDHL